MTKEKAIEILKYIKHVGNGESEYVGCAQEIALDMAMKALEQKHDSFNIEKETGVCGTCRKEKR